MLTLKKKISNKQFKKSLITAKLKQKIDKAPIVIFNNVMNTGENLNTLDKTVGLSKYSKPFIRDLQAIVIKFPFKLSVYTSNSCFLTLKNINSLIIKHKNILLKYVNNKTIKDNFNYLTVFKKASVLLNSILCIKQLYN